jgi:hypothetical protein
MVVRGEKLGDDMWMSKQACWGLCQELFFLRAIGSIQLYGVNVKGCHIIRLVRRAYVSCVFDFSYRMYIDSHHRDSQI